MTKDLSSSRIYTSAYTSFDFFILERPKNIYLKRGGESCESRVLSARQLGNKRKGLNKKIEEKRKAGFSASKIRHQPHVENKRIIRSGVVSLFLDQLIFFPSFFSSSLIPLCVSFFLRRADLLVRRMLMSPSRS